MHIAPKPGLIYPVSAPKKLHHEKGLLFCVLFLFLGLMGISVGSRASDGLNGETAGKYSALVTLTNTSYTPTNTFSLPPGVPDVDHPKTELIIVLDSSFAGQGLNKIKAHIVDEFGNPVVGADVSFTWNPGTGDVSVGATTDALGDAYLQTGFITPGILAIKGKVRIGATWVPLMHNNPIEVTYIAYVPDVEVPETRLITVTTGAKADGIATNCVKAHVAGTNGLPVDGQTVTFHFSGTATAVSPLTATTDLNGDATLCLKSTLAGNVSVTAEVNGTAITNGSPAMVTFVADVPSTSNPDTKFTVEINNAVANGTDNNQVKAHIEDANGNPVGGQPVTFTILSGTASPATVQTVITDANGNAVLNYTSTVAGTVSVEARVGGATINGSPKNITFVADVPSTGVSTTFLETTSNNNKANGTATNCVKAHVTDAQGNKVAGQAIVFTISGGTASPATPVTVITNAQGEASSCYTSLVAGNIIVTATVNGTTVNIPQTLTFVADAPSTSNPLTTFTVVKNNAVANGTDNNQVKAHIVDAHGNPVANQAIVIEIVSGTASPATVQTVMTDASGDAILNYTSTVAGMVTVKASVGGAAISGSPKNITFITDAPSTGVPTTYLETTSNNGKANGTATNCVKAHVTDAQGNKVAGQAVVFTISGVTASPATPVTVITNAQGEASSCYTSLVAVNIIVTATVNGTTVNIPQTLTFVADAPSTSNPLTTFTVVKNNAVANGTDNNQVKAHIVDAHGNPVANQAIVIEIVSGTASPATVQTVMTDASGDAILNYTSTVAGMVTVKASIGGAAISGSPKNITFITDAPSTGVPTTYLETTSNNGKANGTATNCVKAHVTDAQGNKVAGQAVVFTISGVTASPATPVTVTTNAQGEASSCYTSLVAGNIIVTATVNGVPINTAQTLTFVADAPSTSNPLTTFTVVKNNAAANGTDNNQVKAHIADAHGNPVANQAIVIEIMSGTASPSTVQTVTTDANGDAILNYTSTIAGVVTVKASLGGTDIGGSPVAITFIADVPNATLPTTYLQEIKTVAQADGVDENSVLAHVTDAHGNPVANQDVVFLLTGSSNGTMTVHTDADGNAILTIKSTAAGKVTITATVNGDPIVTGSPCEVEFLTGPADPGGDDSRLEVVADNAAADNTANNSVQAHIADAYGNPVSGQTVTFTIAGGTASAGVSPTTYTTTTDADGNALFEFHSDRGGDVTVRAWLNPADPATEIVNGDATVHFVANPDMSNPDTRIEVVTDNAFANGTATNSVRVHIEDAYGNPLENKPVYFQVVAGNADITTTGPFVTDANGDIVISLTSTRPGIAKIEARVNGVKVTNGDPATIRFIQEDIWVPKVFTPNGDGTNDVLRPIITGDFQLTYFTVYNRWGNLVFTSANVNDGWDGRLKGVMQPVETYLWMIGGTDKEGKPVQRKGMVSLVR